MTCFTDYFLCIAQCDQCIDKVVNKITQVCCVDSQQDLFYRLYIAIAVICIIAIVVLLAVCFRIQHKQNQLRKQKASIKGDKVQTSNDQPQQNIPQQNQQSTQLNQLPGPEPQKQIIPAVIIPMPMVPQFPVFQPAYDGYYGQPNFPQQEI